MILEIRMMIRMMIRAMITENTQILAQEKKQRKTKEKQEKIFFGFRFDNVVTISSVLFLNRTAVFIIWLDYGLMSKNALLCLAAPKG